MRIDRLFAGAPLREPGPGVYNRNPTDDGGLAASAMVARAQERAFAGVEAAEEKRTAALVQQGTVIARAGEMLGGLGKLVAEIDKREAEQRRTNEFSGRRTQFGLASDANLRKAEAESEPDGRDLVQRFRALQDEAGTTLLAGVEDRQLVDEHESQLDAMARTGTLTQVEAQRRRTAFRETLLLAEALKLSMGQQSAEVEIRARHAASRKLADFSTAQLDQRTAALLSSGIAQRYEPSQRRFVAARSRPRWAMARRRRNRRCATAPSTACSSTTPSARSGSAASIGARRRRGRSSRRSFSPPSRDCSPPCATPARCRPSSRRRRSPPSPVRRQRRPSRPRRATPSAGSKPLPRSPPCCRRRRWPRSTGTSRCRAARTRRSRRAPMRRCNGLATSCAAP
jgi:hypothetical protein